MKTEVIKVVDIKEDYNNIVKAAKTLKNGEVVAIPTETVYGLAANIYNEEAAKKIFIAKGRPQDNPLIVHISSLKQLQDICTNISEDVIKLANKFWPGPLTIILNRKESVPNLITAGLSTIAVRFPKHPVAQAIITEAGFPLVAPSANLSGKPSTTTVSHCINDLWGKIPLIVDGGTCEIGLESTIIDMTINPAVILRPGAITKEDIQSILPDVRVSTLNKIDSEETPKAPGMKYRHYAPTAPLTLVKGDSKITANWILENAAKQDGILYFEEYKNLFVNYINAFSFNAKNLFSILRELDKLNVKKIFVQCPDEIGLGTAVVNRLEKAAGNNIIEI